LILLIPLQKTKLGLITIKKVWKSKISKVALMPETWRKD